MKAHWCKSDTNVLWLWIIFPWIILILVGGYAAMPVLGKAHSIEFSCDEELRTGLVIILALVSKPFIIFPAV